MKEYIPVAGDQALFDCAPNDATAVIARVTGPSYYKCDGGAVLQLKGGEWYSVAEFHAQRSIKETKEPKRWTVADQKAGRLPGVGAEYTRAGYDIVLTCVFIDAQSYVWGYSKTKDMYRDDIEGIIPVETPEEKAERLRDEWVDDAYGNTYVFGGTNEGEKQRLKLHLRSVYDSMLSGELSEPTK